MFTASLVAVATGKFRQTALNGVKTGRIILFLKILLGKDYLYYVIQRIPHQCKKSPRVMYEIALANSYFEPQSPHEGSILLISSSSMFL